MIQFDWHALENFKIRNFQASLRHTIFFIGLIRSISIYLHSPASKLVYLRLFQQALLILFVIGYFKGGYLAVIFIHLTD